MRYYSTRNEQYSSVLYPEKRFTSVFLLLHESFSTLNVLCLTFWRPAEQTDRPLKATVRGIVTVTFAVRRQCVFGIPSVHRVVLMDRRPKSFSRVTDNDITVFSNSDYPFANSFIRTRQLERKKTVWKHSECFRNPAIKLSVISLSQPRVPSEFRYIAR